MPDFTQMQWEDRPYGKRTSDGYIQLYPHKNTSLGVNPTDLDEFGLRPHPGQIWEHVELLGYLEGSEDNNFPLLYRFRAKNSNLIHNQYYAKGARFYSVQMDKNYSGYWHLLKNVSDRTIVLRITKLNKDK